MKRLVERMHQDNALIFKERQIPFEPRWFLLLSLLDTQPKLGIMEIARELKLAHPTVVVLVNEMIREKVVSSVVDKHDKRKRLLSLTSKGHQMLKDVKPLWQDMTAAANQLILDTGYDVISVLSALEQALDRESYADRIRGFIAKRGWEAIEILEFQSDFAPAFRQLNEAWLLEYGYDLEPHDKQVLSNPKKYIVEPGGTVFFATVQGNSQEMLGTCAVIAHGNGRFELSKMCVAPDYQGRQIGKKLIKTAIEWVKGQKGALLFLETTHQMERAIHLYRKMGFESKPFPEIPHYSRAEVYMEKKL
ncbi:MAG: bifunctional helix-turn-helix transcriptional regulator/GNAT family N-acetyltransferase [Cyanobacteria bacterium]|nr:bifunctional helix-turn-helix transcriptional regulator/GNAT family N-acetyltransferase [Cyanobacteriota bacterium]